MAKKQAKPQPAASASPPRDRSLLAIAGVVLVVVIAIGYYWSQRSPASEQQASASAASQPVQPSKDAPQSSAGAQPGAVVPASARFGPHTQESYPPLPDVGFPPPRPIETVRAVYQFAAEHPEVLSYIPCYCGCDRQGHKGNDDCFVAERDAQGNVQAWDGHGMT